VRLAGSSTLCGKVESICTRTGTVRYFETESDVLEFLAEIDDAELN
jgi:hypothetical protein